VESEGTTVMTLTVRPTPGSLLRSTGAAAALALALAGCGGGGGGGGLAAPSNLSYAPPGGGYAGGFAIAQLRPTGTGTVDTWAITAGALPDGLALDGMTGAITGRPLKVQAGSFTATVEATNATGSTTFALAIDVVPPAATRFALSVNTDDGTVASHAVDGTSGSLCIVDYATAGTQPRDAAATPEGDFVYVGNEGSDDVSAFAFDPIQGTLTEVMGSPFAAGVEPVSVAVEPNGAFLYVANNNTAGTGSISQYSIDAGTGALTPLGTPSIMVGTNVNAVVVEPLGRFAYASHGLPAGEVHAFSIGAGGELTFVANRAAGDSPIGLAAHPSGDFLYAANSQDGNVTGYSIDPLTGDLTELANSPYATTGAFGPTRVAVSADGAALYALSADGTLDPFEVDLDGSQTGTAGALVAVVAGPASVGASAFQLAAAPSGGFVYATNAVDDRLAAFAVQGDLSLAPTADPLFVSQEAPTDLCLVPGAAPVDRVTTHLYASNFGDDDIAQFSVDAAGALTPLTPALVPTGAGPNWLQVHPQLGVVYSVNSAETTNAVEVFGVGMDGTLASLQTNPQGAVSAWSYHVDPSGRYGYGINSTLNQVVPCAIGADGTLTPDSAVATGLVPGAGDAHPTGKFLYIPNVVGDTVIQYGIDLATGVPTALAPSTVATGDSPIAIDVHPNGRFAYVANNGTTNDVSSYAVGATGVLTELTASPTAAGTDPFDALVHPSGAFLFVANRGGDDLTVYTINLDPADATEDGSLTFLATQALSGTPHRLCFGHGGDVLYVTLADPSGQVESFTVDGAGALTALGLTGTGAEARGLTVVDELQ